MATVNTDPKALGELLFPGVEVMIKQTTDKLIDDSVEAFAKTVRARFEEELTKRLQVLKGQIVRINALERNEMEIRVTLLLEDKRVWVPAGDGS